MASGQKIGLIIAVVAVLGIGIAIGRYSRKPADSGPAGVAASSAAWTPAPPSSTASPRASGSAAPADGPMQFDLQEIPTFTAGIPLRPMDRDIFAALTSGKITREQVPDLFPDRPYRVRLMGSPSDQHFSGLNIDLERNGKIDERWTMRPGAVERMVPNDPAADGQPVKYTLSHGRWQLH
jgi:hypothetical protein